MMPRNTWNLATVLWLMVVLLEVMDRWVERVCFIRANWLITHGPEHITMD